MRPPRLQLLSRLWARRRQHAMAAESTDALSSVEVGSSSTPAFSSKSLGKKAKAPPHPPLEDCPICHDPIGFANPEGIVESWVSLHCTHRFGNACIQTWLQESLERDPNHPPSCPICRADAKHPECGHHVCPPPIFSHWNGFSFQAYNPWLQQYVDDTGLFSVALDAPLPPPPPSNRRQRNRLQRRPGHPARPPPPPKPTVQPIGDCKTCADIQEHELRVKRAEEQQRQRQQKQEQAAQKSPTGSMRQVALKAFRPTLGLKRAATPGPSVEVLRVEQLEEPATPRVQSVMFALGGPVLRAPRTPTPAPVQRRLSI